MLKATPVALNLKKQQHQPSDEVLVRAIIQKEDTQLFEILYDRYYAFVHKRCSSFFKNKQDAEDVSQEIFFKVFLKLDTFSFKSKFSTWLYSFAQNYCINYIRQIRYRKLEDRHIDPEKLSDYFFSYNYESCEIDPAQLVRLKHAISLLPIHEQQLLLMKYCWYISVKELGDLYGLGESAIKMKLKRIKGKLISNYRETDLEKLKFA